MLVPALVSALIACGTLVTTGGLPAWERIAGVSCALGLAAYWTIGFHRNRFARSGDLLETLAMVVVLAATPGQPPLPLFGTTFRSLYGSLWLTMLRVAAWITAIVVTALLRGSFDLNDQIGKAAGLLIGALLMQMLVLTITQLQRSERRLSTVLEHTADLVTIVGSDGRVTWQSGAAGHDLERLIGRSLHEFAHPDDAERVRAALTDGAPDPGETATVACRMIDWNGEQHDVEVIISNQVEERRISGLLVTLRDVTARRQLEDQRVELELLAAHVEAQHVRQQLEARLQRALRLESVGQLAGGVAHDFNNLLAVILNYTEIVREDLPETDPAHEDLAEIQLAAERGARLVRQLLLFSRGEASEPEPLSLNATIEAMDGLLSRSLPDNVQLRYELADGLAEIEAVVTNLEQILVNLVVNARDALGASGGEIVISTAPADTGFVRLSVADDGCGMDEDTLNRVVEPFFTTKAIGEGTGLGLSTVHGIVNGAGGHLAFDSDPGTGTSVHVHLPTADRIKNPDLTPIPVDNASPA
jgi:PAS domain S-box-containing protein